MSAPTPGEASDRLLFALRPPGSGGVAGRDLSGAGALEALDGAAGLPAAAGRALALGAPGVVAIPGAPDGAPEFVAPLLALAQERPEVLVVGRRSGKGASRRFHRLRFRLQTGIALADPASPWRVYPAQPLSRLRPLAGGALQHDEALVRAAWGGVPIVEVALPASPAHRSGRWDRPGVLLAGCLLHLHLVMRAVMPLPHRRLAEGAAEPGIRLGRPVEALRGLLRENATPSQLAAAAALGILLGTLPLLALHSLVILMAAGFLRLNRLLALGSSQLCMPPLVPALCVEVGHRLRHGRWLTELSLETLGHQALERLWEWLLGSLLLAPVLALGVGAVVYGAALLLRRQMAPG
jgi:uncharacterized protein (DUF2062 family)